MMKAHPTALALLDVGLEGCHRFRFPAVRDKIQLKHQPVFGQKCSCNAGGGVDVIDFKAVFLPAFLQPGLSRIGKRQVMAVCLRQRQHFEPGLFAVVQKPPIRRVEKSGGLDLGETHVQPEHQTQK